MIEYFKLNRNEVSMVKNINLSLLPLATWVAPILIVAAIIKMV